MADLVKELGIKVTIDSSGVEAGAAGVGTALEGAGKKGADGLDKATTAAKGLGDEATKAGTKSKEALEGVLGPSAKLEAQIAKTGNALSPRGIVDGAAKIKIALEDIEAEARRTGQAIGPELAAQMNRAEQAIATAIPRAGRLADTIADTRKQAGLAAEGYKVLAASGTSLTGIFGLMDDAGKGWVSTLGKIGIGAVGAVGAVMLVKDAAEKAGEAYTWVTDKMETYQRKAEAVQTKAMQLKQAHELVAKGLIQEGTSVDDLLKKREAYILQQGISITKNEEMIKSLGGSVKTHSEVAAEVKKLGDAFEGEFKRSLSNGQAYAVQNESTIKSVAKLATVLGIELTPAFKNALAAAESGAEKLRRFEEATTRLSGAQAALKSAFEAGTTAMDQNAKKADQDLNKAYITARESIRALDRDLAAGTISLREHSDKKREILKKEDEEVSAAYANQEAAQKSFEDSLKDVAAKYGLSRVEAEGLTLAIKAQSGEMKTSKDATDSLAGVAKQLAENLREQDAKFGSTKTSAEKYKDALAGVVISAQSLAKDGTDGVERFTAKLGDGFVTVAGKMQEFKIKVDELPAMWKKADEDAGPFITGLGVKIGGLVSSVKWQDIKETGIHIETLGTNSATAAPKVDSLAEATGKLSSYVGALAGATAAAAR